MKVLHLIDSLGGSGGAEQGMVREIVRFSRDIEQVVVRMFPADHLAPIAIEAGVRDHWLGLTDHSATKAYPQGIRAMRALIRTEQPDVVHTSLFAANIVGQVAARLTRTPTLSTFTLSGDASLLRAHQPGGASRKAEILRKIGAYSARGSTIAFRALTEDAATTNIELLGIDADRVTVIPRGVPADLRPSKLMDRTELGLPASGRLVVSVGREVAQKGQVHLMRVFARLRERHDDLHLVICGRPGEKSDELTELTSSLGLEGHVTRFGYTPHVHHIVAHASLFGFPSLMEGLGTALLEAMSIGTPIVAFDIPPVREAVGETGAALVPLLDEDAFHERAETFLSDAAAHAEQVAAGRTRVTTAYDVDRIAARVQDLLVETANRF